MRRSALRLTLLALAGFIAVALVRAPLPWALKLLPRRVHCDQPGGTLWQGHCAALSIADQAAGPMRFMGEVDWALRPARLLRGRLAAQVRWSRGLAQARALVQLGIARTEILDLDAQLPLDPGLLPGAPRGIRGELRVSGAQLRFAHGELRAAEGDASVEDLQQTSPSHVALGSYALHLPRGSDSGLAVGQLRDLGGPLQLQGQLHLKANLAWQIDGRVAARASADPSLVEQIRFLGSPDAQGLRPFSLAGG